MSELQISTQKIKEKVEIHQLEFTNIINNLEKESKDLKIIDSESFENANCLKNKLKEAYKTYEILRTETVKPFNDFVSWINNCILTVTKKGKEIEKTILDMKILDYKNEMRNKQIEENNRIGDIIDNINKCETTKDFKEYLGKIDIKDQKNTDIITAVKNKIQLFKDKKARKEREEEIEAMAKEDEETAKKEKAKLDKETAKKEADDEKLRLKQQKENTKIQKEQEKELNKGIVKRWTFEVVNLDEVPREYLMIDDKKVKEAIKNEVREIKGLNIKQSKSVK